MTYQRTYQPLYETDDLPTSLPTYLGDRRPTYETANLPMRQTTYRLHVYESANISVRQTTCLRAYQPIYNLPTYLRAKSLPTHEPTKEFPYLST
jgi:hypothetical protein